MDAYPFEVIIKQLSKDETLPTTNNSQSRNPATGNNEFSSDCKGVNGTTTGAIDLTENGLKSKQRTIRARYVVGYDGARVGSKISRA